MTNRKYALFLILAGILCLIPLIWMIVGGPSPAAANEVLAGKPQLRTADGTWNTAYLSDLNDYFADHFGGRQQLITANAAIEATLFHESASDQVILGEDGWLYYASTLDDYTGSAQLSDRRIWAAAHTLSLMQEYAASQNAEFLFTLVPNKNTLYGDAMPSCYPAAEEAGNRVRLDAALEQEGVAFLDLTDAFQAEDEVLYHKLDSHWTNLGAALAHDAIEASLGHTSQQFYQPDAYTAVKNHKGDLYQMLYPAGTGLDVQYEPTFSLDFSYEKPIRSAEDQRICTSSDAASGTLLMFRDSFGNTLHPFLAASYASATFLRAMPYDMTQLQQEDTLLIEIVERNIAWLCERAPMMPAPQRTICVPQVQTQTATSLHCEDINDMTLLRGELAVDFDTDSSIYLLAEGKVYEASPVGQNEGSFTAYLTEKPDTLQVLYQQDGLLRLSQPLSTTGKEENLNMHKGVQTALAATACGLLITVAAPTAQANNAVFLQDVSQSDWHYAYVRDVYELGLMNGTSSTTFHPDSKVTGGMVMTILYRMAGAPQVERTPTDEDAYYADAVQWAIDLGLCEEDFSPEEPMTREQTAILLHRFSNSNGCDLTAASLDAFADADSLSEAGMQAFSWAVDAEIFGGSNGLLHPADPLTRAELAAVLVRYCEKYAEISTQEPNDSEPIDVSHAAYLVEEDCYFRPHAALSGAEFSQMLQALFGSNGGANPKAETVSLHTFYTYVLRAAGASEKVKAAFHGLRTDAADTVTRLEAVTLLNRVADRIPDSTALAAVQTPLYLDVTSGTDAFYEILEATTDHQAQTTATEETWKVYDLESRALKEGIYRTKHGNYLLSAQAKRITTPGIVTLSGEKYLMDATSCVIADDAVHMHDDKLVYCKANGTLAREETIGSLYFGEDGFYTSSDAELDELVEDCISSNTSENMTQMEKLRAVYNYVRERKYLGRNAALPSTSKTFTQEETIGFAKVLLKTGKGDCYNFAAAFCCLARALGFDAESVVGNCSYVWSSRSIAHGWVEITVDGETYLFDPQIENYNIRNGISNEIHTAFKVTYETAPGKYYKN